MTLSVKLTVLVLLAGASAHCMEVFDRDQVTRTFTNPKIERIFIDNISGSITVIGKPIKEIRLIAKRTVEAESADKIAEAKEDVTLQTNEIRDRLEIIVDAPWRDGENLNWHGKEFYGYEVSYDFELEVPQEMILFVKTINKGKITIENVHGKFDLKNVNGPIIAKGLAAGGSIHTVNGIIEARFTESPKEPCSFKTVNGEIEATFPTDLSGLIKFKTFNGKAYSDFEFTEIAPEPMQMEQKKGKRIYRRGENTRIQIGSGGPALWFETLNGNINILKTK